MASLLVAYSILGYLVIPWYAKKALKNYVAEEMQRELLIEEIQFNPFSFRLQAVNIALNEKNHSAIGRLTRLDVNVNFDQIFKKTLVISNLELSEPRLELIIDEAGSLNLSRLIQDLSDDSADDDTESALNLLFVLTQIKQGSVLVADYSKEHLVQSTIKDVNLEFSSISTIANEGGGYQIILDLDNDTKVNLTGSLSLTPLISTGQIQIANLTATNINKWVEDILPVEFLSGNASVSGHYKLFSNSEGDVLFDLDKSDISIKNLSIKDSVSQVLVSLTDLNLKEISYGNTQKTAKVKLISLSDLNASTQATEPLVDLASLSLSDFSYGIETAALELATAELIKLSLVPRNNTPAFVELGRATINDIVVSENFQHVRIGQSELTENHYLLETDATGRLLLPEFNITDEQENEGSSNVEASSSDRRIELSELKLTQTTLSTFISSQPDQYEKLLNLSNVVLTAADVDIAESNVVVESLALADANVNLTLDKAGSINVLQLFSTDASIEEESTSITEKSSAQFKLGKLTTQDFDIQVIDNTLATSLQHRLHNIKLEALYITNENEGRTEMNLNAAINNQGTISLAGWVAPISTDAEFDIGLSEIGLAYLSPYIENYANVSLVSGALSFKGKVINNAGNNGVTIKDAKASLSKLQFDDNSNNSRLIAVDAVGLAGFGLSTQPLNLTVKEIMLSEPYVNVHIDEQKNLNLLNVIKPAISEPTNSGQKVSDTESTYSLAIDRIDMDKGNMDFADLSMTPKFSVKVHGLTGNVSGLNSHPERYTSMQLSGRVNEFGSLSISGELQPFDYRKLSDINMEFKNISTNSLSPYAAKFAGRKIESGSLSLSLDYKVANNKLNGTNSIILEKLVLGEKVSSPDAMDLPLDMAISLLEDDNGKIDLKLPIKGDLNNPEFEMKAVINKAIGNLVGGIVTAPFKFIGSIFGMSGDELKYVQFVPGETGITPPEEEKLTILSKALLERPALLLIVSGAYNQKRDSLAIAKKILRENISMNSSDGQVRLNYSDPEVQSEITDLADQRLDETTRLKLEELSAKDNAVIDNIYYENLFDYLAQEASVDINQAKLKELATDRAKAIAKYIIETEKTLVDRVRYLDEVVINETEDDLINIKLDLDTQR